MLWKTDFENNHKAEWRPCLGSWKPTCPLTTDRGPSGKQVVGGGAECYRDPDKLSEGHAGRLLGEVYSAL